MSPHDSAHRRAIILLDEAGEQPGRLAARLQVLHSQCQSLAQELSELRAGGDFQLGDAIVSKVSPRAEPELLLPDVADLDWDGQARALLSRREDLQRQLALVRSSLRLKLGRGTNELWSEGALAFSHPVRLVGRMSEALLAEIGRRLPARSGPQRLCGRDGSPVRSGSDLSLVRLCLYAQVDPNRIDGATIWLASLAEVLAGLPSVRLTILLGAPLKRTEVLGHLLDRPEIRFVHVRPEPKPGRCLSGHAALKALLGLDDLERQHLFIVRGPGELRGKHILEIVAGCPQLAERCLGYVVEPQAWASPLGRVRLWRVGGRMRGLLCQTREAQTMLQTRLGAGSGAEVHCLPPMIPGQPSGGRELPPGKSPRLVYAGKFSPPYRILEMVRGFQEIRRQFPGAEFHVVGDKFHNRPKMPGFEVVLREALAAPGVVWHGGLSRQRTLEIIDEAHLACSWRDQSFDSSLELATKVLEYCGRGLPVLLNPTAMHQRLLGQDYPGFLEADGSFAQAVCHLLGDSELYERAAARAAQVAEQFTFDRARQRMNSVLDGISP